MPVFRRLRKEAPSGGENGLLARAAEPTHLKMTGPLLGGVKACQSTLSRFFTRTFDKSHMRQSDVDGMQSESTESSESNSPTYSTYNTSPPRLDGHPTACSPGLEQPRRQTDATQSGPACSGNADLTGVGTHLAAAAAVPVAPSAPRSQQATGRYAPLASEEALPYPFSSTRLSRSDSPGITRPNKRSSYVSSVGSWSLAESVFDGYMSDSVATSHGNESFTAFPTVAGILPTKRQKLVQSPSSSRSSLIDTSPEVDLDSAVLANRPRSTPDTAIGHLREGLSPSTHWDIPRPEARHQATAGVRGQLRPRPESVEGQLNCLKIDEGNHKGASKALSIIEENRSDAGNSFQERQSVADGADGQSGLLRVPSREPNLSELSSLSDIASDNDESVLSPITRTTSFRATTVDDEASEQEDDSSSDVSDVSDETNSDTPSTTSFNHDLPEPLLELQRHVRSLAESLINDWVRAHALGSSHHSQAGSSLDVDASAGNSNASEGQNGQSSRKRQLNNDDFNNSGRGDGDDDRGKKPRTRSSSESPTELGLPFACPMVKKYTDIKDWPKSCRTGFPKVHRIKNHIYTKHMLPRHCPRCYQDFKTAPELETHARMEPACLVASRPNTLIGISLETKELLSSREGIQNFTDSAKWNKIYEILFPGEQIPSPYVELGPLGRELGVLKQHVGRKVEENLRRRLPNITDEYLQVTLNTISEVFDESSLVARPLGDAAPRSSHGCIEFSPGTRLLAEQLPLPPLPESTAQDQPALLHPPYDRTPADSTTVEDLSWEQYLDQSLLGSNFTAGYEDTEGQGDEQRQPFN